MNQEIAVFLTHVENFSNLGKTKKIFLAQIHIFLTQENLRPESGKWLFPGSGYYNYLNPLILSRSVYKLLQNDRVGKEGGSVALYVCKSWIVQIIIKSETKFTNKAE